MLRMSAENIFQQIQQEYCVSLMNYYYPFEFHDYLLYDGRSPQGTNIKVENDLKIDEPIKQAQPSLSQVEDEDDSEEYVDKRDKPKTNSVYHNFQKHLITTLKLSITPETFSHNRSQTAKLARELWQYFLKLNKPSKRLLFTVLNQISTYITDEKRIKEISYSQKQLIKFFKSKSEKLLPQAQNYLRLIIITQGKRVMGSNLLQGRRIKKKQHFQQYFRDFIEELEHNQFNARLLKSRRIFLTSPHEKTNDHNPEF